MADTMNPASQGHKNPPSNGCDQTGCATACEQQGRSQAVEARRFDGGHGFDGAGVGADGREDSSQCAAAEFGRPSNSAVPAAAVATKEEEMAERRRRATSKEMREKITKLLGSAAAASAANDTAAADATAAAASAADKAADWWWRR